MTKQEAVDFFGSQTNVATALAIKPHSVVEWGDEPPAIRQIQLERITKGKLKASPECYQPKAAA